MIPIYVVLCGLTGIVYGEDYKELTGILLREGNPIGNAIVITDLSALSAAKLQMRDANHNINVQIMFPFRLDREKSTFDISNFHPCVIDGRYPVMMDIAVITLSESVKDLFHIPPNMSHLSKNIAKNKGVYVLRWNYDHTERKMVYGSEAMTAVARVTKDPSDAAEFLIYGDFSNLELEQLITPEQFKRMIKYANKIE